MMQLQAVYIDINQARTLSTVPSFWLNKYLCQKPMDILRNLSTCTNLCDPLIHFWPPNHNALSKKKESIKG